MAALYGGAVLDSLRSAGLSGQLLTFPAGEAHKTPETWLSLCRQLAQEGFTRSDGLLALGGGVTGDMAGFVAACYQRGMALAQLPTTLLSQVDSAVGGKTAVDLPEGKNLLGAFYQPRLVIADPDCLTTLPRRELRCGMAEVIKYGFIQDAGLLDELETDTPNWTAIIARCLTIKAALVAADERDTGARRLLNFGHTFGHAYEAAGGYAGLHPRRGGGRRDGGHAAVAAPPGRRGTGGLRPGCWRCWSAGSCPVRCRLIQKRVSRYLARTRNVKEIPFTLFCCGRSATPTWRTCRWQALQEGLA